MEEKNQFEIFKDLFRKKFPHAFKLVEECFENNPDMYRWVFDNLISKNLVGKK